MSTTIDQRVVEMEFDNRRFESNVATTMSTLDKLKQSLNLTGAQKGLESVSAAAKGVDLSGISAGIDAIQSKFSAWGIMGVTTLVNLTNTAINAGKRMLSALTIDPIRSGFSEYETKMGSIQTIMSNTASKGTTMEDVTRVIGELNTYADKTIYNFAEMTRNIGTFTAAGIGLEESASAIQGIANLAAASGSTSQQASTAMYQLSQAMAAGTVKLMDWNSVVNAGMGGEKFQEALKATARDHGIAVDEMIEKNGSFRESLQEGWISADILNETLNKFTVDGAINYGKAMVESGKWTQEQADALVKEAQSMEDAATKVKTFTQLWDTLKESAQSGWGQTWELIIGDFEEAKETLTKFSDAIGGIINDSAEARNTLIENAIGKSSANPFRDVTEETLKLSDAQLQEIGYTEDQVSALRRLQTTAKNTGTPVQELIDNVTRPTGRELIIDSIWNSFDALCKIMKPVREAFEEVFPPLTGEQLYSFIEGLNELTEKFIISDETAEKIKTTFKGVFSVLDIGVEAVKAVVGGIIDLISNFAGIEGTLLDGAASIGEWLTGLRDSITETDIFGTTVKKITGFIGNVITKVKEFISALKEKFGAPGWEGFLSLATSIWDIIVVVGQKIAEAAAAIGGVFTEAFRNGDIGTGMDILNTGIFSMILLGIKNFVDGAGEAFEGVSGIFEGVTDILDGVKGSLEAWQSSLQADTLMKIAKAIAILAASLFVLAIIDSEKLTSALSAITVLFIELMTALNVFSKMGGGFSGVTKGVGAMIGIASAVLILSFAVASIANLSWEQLGVGLTGVTVLLAEVVAATKILGKDGGKIMKGAGQMILMAVALKIMASVCADLAELTWEELAKGLAGIGGILLEFAGFAALMKLIKPGNLLSAAVSMVIIGAAMEIFADVCSKFGQMEWGELAKAGAAIGGVLILAAGFMLLSGLASGVIAGSVALVLIGAAMEIFADVCTKFGQMEWEALGKAGAAMAGIMLLAAGFMLLSGLAVGIIGSVIALTIMAAAMTIFADVCTIFGQMEWEALGKAGAAIGGLLLLAAGFALLAGLAPGMIVSAAALLIMAGALAIMTPVLTTLGDMSWGEIVRGLVAIAGVFAILGVAGLLLGPVVPVILSLSGAIALFGVACLAVGIGVTMFATGLTALAVSGAAGAAALVSALEIIIVGIIGLVPAIVTALGNGIVTFCQVIAASATSIAEAVFTVIAGILTVIAENLPVIIEAGMSIIMSLLQGISDNIGGIVTVGAEIIVNFLNGLSEQLPAIIEAGVNLIVTFITGIVDSIATHAEEILAAGADLVNLIFDGITETLSTIAGGVGEIIGSFIGGILTAIVESVADVDVSSITDKAAEFLSAGKELIDKVAEGITSGAEGVDTACETIATGAITAVESKQTDFETAGTTIMTGVVDGINASEESVISSVSVVIANAATGIYACYISFYSGGTYLGAGLCAGIEAKETDAYNAGYALGQAAVQGELDGQQSASPSKATIRAGKWLGEGLVIGMQRMGRAVQNAGEAMGVNAVDSLSESLGNTPDWFSSDSDMQPTIRPILDLSDVESGVGAINSMFGGSPSVGVMANVGAINAMMNQRRQNGVNSEVVTAIDKLRKDLGKTGNTYNSIGGVTYTEGDDVGEAIKTIIRAAKVERRN